MSHKINTNDALVASVIIENDIFDNMLTEIIFHGIIAVHFGRKPRPFGKTLMGVLLVFKMPGRAICHP
uniref:Uncharacterized protein n=1 Tax=Romanomermis culicivorax TaxID=13658 RepID=A0A915JX56_ROMCU